MKSEQMQPPSTLAEAPGSATTPPLCQTIFQVGDIVEATKPFSRVDKRCHLEIGETAKVIRVERTDPQSPQIIALETKSGLWLIDIVCFANVPLRLVYSPNEKGQQ